MTDKARSRVALVWTQFTAYHVDRCIALADRLAGHADVLAVEVATTSRDYAAFGPSGETPGARKLTLFPASCYDDIPRWRRALALYRALFGVRVVFCGIPYSDLDVLLVTLLLRLTGTRVILLCDSKFDDFPRRAGFELAKRIGLSVYSGVMVAGSRGLEFMRFLGFRNKPVLLGTDTVCIARIRQEFAAADRATPTFAARPFVFVGRFLPKKNIPLLVRAYALYCERVGDAARPLELIGSGEQEPEIAGLVASLGLDGKVRLRGFLDGPDLVCAIGGALALVHVSYSEQWGLVINEALALGTPVIVSEAPGARDVLVSNLQNGYVVEIGSIAGLAEAMVQMGQHERVWHRMSASALRHAELGDVAVFCDAVEQYLEPGNAELAQRTSAYAARVETFPGQIVGR